MTIRNYLLIYIFFWLAGCEDTSEAPIIPNVIVNEQINLTNIQYNNLRQDKGFVYLPKAGVRGIILIRESATRYRAIERNCTYQPEDACGIVEVDASNLFLKDPCCGSQFDLSGQVTGGPATYPLRQYATTLQGNFLFITN